MFLGRQSLPFPALSKLQALAPSGGPGDQTAGTLSGIQTETAPGCLRTGEELVLLLEARPARTCDAAGTSGPPIPSAAPLGIHRCTASESGNAQKHVRKPASKRDRHGCVS